METAVLIFLPIVAGVLIYAFDDAKAKYFALGAALIEFIASIVAYTKFSPSAGFQFTVNQPWIPSMGINFHVAIDGISLMLVFLTTFLVPLIILSTFKDTYAKGRLFYSLILLMQSALIGVFV